MATTTPLDPETVRRRREAWDDYAAELDGLEGRAYEDAEAVAWQHLVQRLGELPE